MELKMWKTKKNLATDSYGKDRPKKHEVEKK